MDGESTVVGVRVGGRAVVGEEGSEALSLAWELANGRSEPRSPTERLADGCSVSLPAGRFLDAASAPTTSRRANAATVHWPLIDLDGRKSLWQYLQRIAAS